MEKTKEQRMADFQHKTFVLMFRILVIFGAPAAIAFFVGRHFDTTYDIRPYGSLAVLAVAFVFSWFLIFRMYMKLEKERKEIEAMEDTIEPTDID